MATTTLDVKGLCCPLPILRARRVVRNLKPGDILEVLTTDLTAPKDFEMFCKSSGYDFVECKDEDSFFTIVIRKNE